MKIVCSIVCLVFTKNVGVACCADKLFKTGKKTRHASWFQKQIIAKASVELVARDLNSLSSLSKSGMVSFVQAILDIQNCADGSKVPPLDAEQLLPSRNTVKKYVGEGAKIQRGNIVPQLQQAVKNQELGEFYSH